MKRDLPVIRWCKAEVWENININRLALAALLYPLALSVAAFVLGTIAQGFVAMSVFVLISLITAVAVVATRTHTGLAQYQAALDQGMCEIRMQPWISQLYKNPVQEWLVLACGSFALNQLSWLVALGGGFLLLFMDPVATSLAATIPFLTGNIWIPVILLLFVSAKWFAAGIALAGILLVLGQAGPALAVLVATSRNLFGRFSVRRGNGEQGRTSTGSFYIFHAVDEGILADAAERLGGYAKAKHAITLATKEEMLSPERIKEGWQPIEAGDLYRGQRLDTGAMLGRLEEY